MNRHILFIALILSVSIIGTTFAMPTAQKVQGTVIQNQPTDDNREEELVLLPEILDRLEGISSDESDLGPEIPEGSSITPINNSEPNLLEMEDDSDYADNIYNEAHEKNLLNANDDDQIGEADEDNDASTDSTDSSIITDGDVQESEDDLKGGIETIKFDGINNKFQEYEVSPCVVIQIPINQTSVIVTLQNVLNSGRAMLTNQKYENCLELIEFECPENTTFCQTQDFADDAAEFLLDQEACGLDNAYLYISPSDIEQTILYKVKVEDNGEPLCENTNQAQTNETSQDAENSESDEDFIDIGMTAIEIDNQYHEFNGTLCTVVEIPIGEQSVRVMIENVLNSGRAMITDKQYENCVELMVFECPEDAKFCKTQDLAEIVNDFVLDQEACGVANAYLYIAPSDIEQELSYKVKVEDTGAPQCSNTTNTTEPQTNEESDVTPAENSESEEEESLFDGDIERSPIGIDNEFHIFDVSPCNVVEIPLNKHSVRVTVENMFNSGRVMLTDVQFENCLAVMIFECPENTTFCKTENLDEAVNDLVLDQETCGIDKAYLYVAPMVLEEVVSYRVKVEDTGASQCGNTTNTTEAQTNDTPQEQEESESDSEPETPAENSDSDEEDPFDSDYDDTDLDEEINDDQIMEGTAEVDGKLHPFDTSICTVIAIPINKQPVDIVVNDVFNSAKIMVTDTKMANCSVFPFFECPDNNTFCQIQSLHQSDDDAPDGVQITSEEASNLDTVYLYVYPTESEIIVSYELKVTVVDNSTTPAINEDSDDQPSEDNTNTTTPSTEDSSDDSDTETVITVPGEADSKEAGPDANQGIADTGSSSLDGGQIVGIIFGASLFIFLVIVCTYRRQFKNNRVECFSPPSWCPNCLFPRIPTANRLINNNAGYNHIEYNDYEPPVL